MRFTQLGDWLTWMEGQHPRHIDLGLERINAVAQALNIQLDTPVVTVAGTNGKGSCIATMAAVLGAAGYRVGCYTSPHLLHYRERISIAGVYPDDDALCAVFEQVDQARQGTSLTYFEFGTLAALLMFKQAELDVVLLEVGLGGRLDAVNIIDADVAVISSVDLDHQAWLGYDRDTIGREKAGILRSGKPAVCGDPQPPRSVLDYSQQQGAPLLQIGVHFGADDQGESWRWFGQSAAGETLSLECLPNPGLAPENLATALQALHLLNLPLSEQAVREGLSTVVLAGRCQHFDVWGIDVVLDVAHNPAAVALLAANLSRRPAPGRTVALFAVMADKAVADIVELIAPHIDEWVLPSLTDNDRAAAPNDVADVVKNAGACVSGKGESLGQALRGAVSSLTSGDRVVVFGSFFTVAEAMTALTELGLPACQETIQA